MSDDHVMEEPRLEVRAPGVRLTQAVMGKEDDERQQSALPVFIGWPRDGKPQGTPRDPILIYVPNWAKGAEYCSYDDPVLSNTLRHYFDNGGAPCFVLLGEGPSATWDKTEALAEWWNHFVDKVGMVLLSEPGITLVAVPQLAAAIGCLAREVQVKTLITLWQALFQACERRSDLFFVLDTPIAPANATACLEAIRQAPFAQRIAQRVALYGPHLVTDYRQNEEEAGNYTDFCVVPPCGAVLGVYGRTDAAEGVWKAPANETLWHVVQPQYRETMIKGWFDADRPSINLIRSFAGRGIRIWGCRTLAAGMPFRYVQVRRTVTWIEANLQQICRFAIFEPNNEITWFQVQGLCRAWLRRVWLDGGLAGADEASAYSVRVGLNESMTLADIEAGRLIVQVGVSVLHAAEFIDVKLELTMGNVASHDTESIERVAT